MNEYKISAEIDDGRTQVALCRFDAENTGEAILKAWVEGIAIHQDYLELEDGDRILVFRYIPRIRDDKEGIWELEDSIDATTVNLLVSNNDRL